MARVDIRRLIGAGPPGADWEGRSCLQQAADPSGYAAQGHWFSLAGRLWSLRSIVV